MQHAFRRNNRSENKSISNFQWNQSAAKIYGKLGNRHLNSKHELSFHYILIRFNSINCMERFCMNLILLNMVKLCFHFRTNVEYLSIRNLFNVFHSNPMHGIEIIYLSLYILLRIHFQRCENSWMIESWHDVRASKLHYLTFS